MYMVPGINLNGLGPLHLIPNTNSPESSLKATFAMLVQSESLNHLL